MLPLAAPVAQGKPRKGGTFNFAFPGLNFVQRDSHTQLGASEWHAISEKAIKINPRTAELQSSVAVPWEVPDPKGLTLVRKVKPGLQMHNLARWNGRDFNAQGLAWSLERIDRCLCRPSPPRSQASIAASVLPGTTPRTSSV